MQRSLSIHKFRRGGIKGMIDKNVQRLTVSLPTINLKNSICIYGYQEKRIIKKRSINHTFFNITRSNTQNSSSVVPKLYYTFSTNSSSSPVIPVKIYSNADLDKLIILKENKLFFSKKKAALRARKSRGLPLSQSN